VDYQHEARHDPGGDALRVLRGGAWNDNARHDRVSYRVDTNPDFFYDYVGLRVVVAPVL